MNARLHELGLLPIFGGPGPGCELREGYQLLLEAFEHLERRRHQVVGTFVAGQRQVA